MSSRSIRKAKRRLKKNIKLLFVFLILAFMGAGTYYLYNNIDKFVTLDAPADVETKEELREESPQPKEYKASLFMVGDALIHSTLFEDAYQPDGTYDFRPQLSFVKPISSRYDLAYYNQETILGGAMFGYSNYPRFNSPSEVGDAFIDAGFNMVSLASNHTMDKGEQGVLNSVAYWKQHPEVAVSGQWTSEEERTASISKVYEVNNIKYAFIAYTIWNNGLTTPYGKSYLNNEYTPEKAAADIALVRDKVDFVIVAMHWGTEYSHRVDYKQEEIAMHLSNLGVDLIIGAHPHVVQTVEYINNGKTFVIYSLGNIISDQRTEARFTGLAFEVTLKKHVDVDQTVTNTIVDPKAELFYTTHTHYRNFRAVPYPLLNDSILPNYLSKYEYYKAIVNECYPNLTWGLTWEW